MHNLCTTDCATAQADTGKPSRITAAQFLAKMFAHTTENVYVCSFPNERGDNKQVGERHIATRLPSHITSFMQKWDKPDRGLFFCVGTTDGKRKKENIKETIGLFADLDFNKIDGLPSDPIEARDEVLRHLTRLRFLPSATVFSGGGVHAYWLFKEAVDSQAEKDRIEAALRQLADIVAGDLPVCEIARVLRLPGSHNTKNGAWTEVEVTSFDPDRRYELDDLEEWFAEQSPVLMRKKRAGMQFLQIADEPFLEFSRVYGSKRVDVEERLKGMTYKGAEDSSIHQTQLACSAAMLNRGRPVDEVVATVLAHTVMAAGAYAGGWDWEREYHKVRNMCDDWIVKRRLKCEGLNAASALPVHPPKTLEMRP